MDQVEEKIRAVKDDFHHDDCRSCGAVLSRHRGHDENYRFNDDRGKELCRNCLLVASQREPRLIIFTDDPVCKWCGREFKIQCHAWCESCRDKHQANVITIMMRNGEWDKGGDMVDAIKAKWPAYKKLYENKTGGNNVQIQF